MELTKPLLEHKINNYSGFWFLCVRWLWWLQFNVCQLCRLTNGVTNDTGPAHKEITI
jgi:hypothetical protein